MQKAEGGRNPGNGMHPGRECTRDRGNPSTQLEIYRELNGFYPSAEQGLEALSI